MPLQLCCVRDRLFPCGVEGEALQHLRLQLENIKAESDQAAGDCARRDAVAFRLEALLRSEEKSPSSPTVFLKTFNHLCNMGGVRNEIAVCGSRMPDLAHENVCGVSRASFGALVEPMLEGHGRVGLLARLPFVAMEDCDGCDLHDLFSCRALDMPWSFTKWAQAPVDGAADILQAAADFLSQALCHLGRAQRALGYNSRVEFVNRLASLALDPLARPGAVAAGDSAAAILQSWPLSKLGKLDHLGKLPFPYDRVFKDGVEMKAWLNHIVDLVRDMRLSNAYQEVNSRKWILSGEVLIEAEGRKLNLSVLKDVAHFDPNDSNRWGTSWPLSLVAAGRLLQTSCTGSMLPSLISLLPLTCWTRGVPPLRWRPLHDCRGKRLHWHLLTLPLSTLQPMPGSFRAWVL